MSDPMSAFGVKADLAIFMTTCPRPVVVTPPNPIYSHEIMRGATPFTNLTVQYVPSGAAFEIDYISRQRTKREFHLLDRVSRHRMSPM
jgi:hypothetical protein